ncbi:MAG: transcriptional regulator [Ktedonobacterales bacterium]
MERIRKVARRFNRTVSETSALLLEEAMRTEEFMYIRFFASSAGRQAYLVGSSLAVWEVMFIARAYGDDAERTAEHLGVPLDRVLAAFNYAKAYPDEIQAAIEDNGIDFDALQRIIPAVKLYRVEPEVHDDPVVDATL